MAIISSFPEKRGLNTDDINDIANGEISNGFVQSQFNYSTEEQVIGKWIDGKPLYQKTYTGTLTADKGTNQCWIDENFGTTYKVDKIIKMEGIAQDAGYWVTSINDYEADNAKVMIWYNTSTKGLHLNINGYVGGTYHITICYTKTTD